MKTSTALLLLLWYVAAMVPAAGAASSPDTVDLQKLIRAAVSAGRKPTVSIEIFKKAARATVLSADEQNIKVRAFETELDLRWKDLEAEQIAHIAAEVAGSGADSLVLLRYYVSQNLKERADKAAQKALELDSTLKDEVDQALALLPKEEPKAPPPPVIKSEPPAPKARVNHAGRILPPLPAIKVSVMFNTPEADAILPAIQVFPTDNAWNEDISKRPVLPNSGKIVKNVGANTAIHIDVSGNFIIVPPDQARVQVKIVDYPKLADPGPYPMPELPPIQGWGITKEKLEDMLRAGEGDRHVIVLDPFSQKLYEFYHVYKRPTGWEASAQATFDLTSNQARPKNWISADASGLAMFPGYIKYHELESGVIEHAIRMTVSKTRKAFIWPATHLYAGHTDDPDFPAMGERFRLKASFDVSKLPKQAKAIAVALQKYGAIVCDNGRDWDMCATADKRIDYEQMRAVHKAIKGDDMEVILTTGENEGPRARQ